MFDLAGFLLFLRVLVVMLFAGAFFFYFSVVNPQIAKMAPTHRGPISMSLLRRTIYLSLAYALTMAASGLAYAQVAGLLGAGLVPAGATGPLLLAEVIVNGVMVAAAASSVVIFRRARPSTSFTKVASPFDDSKWLIFPDADKAVRLYGQVNSIFLANLVLGFVSVVLGVLVLRL